MESSTEGAMNMDGTMNHAAFDAKPILAQARKPARKTQAKAFFSDSDDDGAPAQAYPVYQAPPVPEPVQEPVY